MKQKLNNRKHLKLFYYLLNRGSEKKIFKIRLVKIKSLIPAPLEYDFCFLVFSADKQSFCPLILLRLRNILGELYHLLGITILFFLISHPSKTMFDPN